MEHLLTLLRELPVADGGPEEQTYGYIGYDGRDEHCGANKTAAYSFVYPGHF